MVADRECRTPTEAGAVVVPVKRDLTDALDRSHRRLQRALGQLLGPESERLERMSSGLSRSLLRISEDQRRQLRQLASEIERLSPASQLAQRYQVASLTAARLGAASARWSAARRARLDQLAASLDIASQSCGNRRTNLETHLGVLEARSSALFQARLGSAGDRLHSLQARLRALGPQQVLERGYAIAYLLPQGQIVRSAQQVAKGDKIRIQLATGQLRAEVEASQ